MRITLLLCCLWGLGGMAAHAAPETSGRTTNASPFRIRGTLPWHNFLSGPTAWDTADYERYLDRLQELGLNYITFHCYTGGAERYATYVEPLIRIEYRDVVPLATFDTSLTARWGYRPLAIDEFAFGTGRLFPRPKGARAFGAECAVLARDNEDRYARAHALFRQVIQMAHGRGIQVGLGFEFGIHPPEFASIVPPDSWIRGAMLPDPTHPASIEILHATIDDIIESYPEIDWVWLWLHELTMAVGQPHYGRAFRDLLQRDAAYFSEAGHPDQIFTGVWSLAYIREAVRYLEQRAPKVRVAISGWGGGSQLPAIMRGLDRALPTNIVFTCLNPGQGWRPQPSFLADIAAHRPVWAIPWLEGDARLWHLQPRVSLLRDHVQLAARQKLDGVLAIHWRTEEIRPNLEAFAQFARDPEHAPTMEDFYLDDCTRHYGPQAGPRVAAILAFYDREQALRTRSQEYYPYDPQWGRLEPPLRTRIEQDLEELRSLAADITDPTHKQNLEWLRANLEFTLLLDKVGRAMEPAYVLKNRWLTRDLSPDQAKEEAEKAARLLNNAPVRELFETFARRVRSKGELGELSALNQKLWLQYRELQRFLNQLRDTSPSATDDQ